LLTGEAANVSKSALGLHRIAPSTVVAVGWPRTPEEAAAILLSSDSAGAAEPEIEVPSRGVSPAVGAFLSLHIGPGLTGDGSGQQEGEGGVQDEEREVEEVWVQEAVTAALEDERRVSDESDAMDQ